MLFTALLCAPFILSLARFEVTSETRVLLEGDQRNLSSYEKVKQILAGVEVIVISMECREVFSTEGIGAVRRVSEAFERQPGVVDVKSLTHSYKPVRRGLSFEMIPLVPREALTPEEMTRLKKFSLDHPLIRNVMVASDSRHTLITVTYRRDLALPVAQRALHHEIQATLAPFQAEGLKFHVLALPLIEDEIRATLAEDLWKFLPAATALLAVILWLTFRSWPILGLVLINQLATLSIVPGAVQLAGFSLNVFSVMLLPLMAGIHLTLLAHVFTALQRAWQTSVSSDGIGVMLEHVFKPSVFAALTTAIGLLSLTLSDVRQVREFGILGASGIGLLFFMTFGPNLAVVKLTGRDRASPAGPGANATPPTEKPGPGRVWSDRLVGWVEDHRKAILGGAMVCIAATALGVSRVRTDIRAVEFLNRRSPTRQAVEELDKVYGGINVVQIELDSGKENAINAPAFLKFVDAVQTYAASRQGVSGAYSYAQLLAMMNQIWEGDDPAAFRLPENPLLVGLFVVALKSQNYPFLTALADPTFRTAYLVIRTRDMPSDRYLALIADIVNYAKKTKPESAAVSATQGLHSILEADRRIIRSQVNSAGATLAVIGLVLALLWRSVALAVLALVANAIPVAFVVAVAGYLDVPLNSITIMVAAISLGIAVDDSIHFITYWREQCRRGIPVREAIRETFRAKGRPIVFTSVILIALFSVFWFSSFPPIVHFGLLSAVAFLSALLSVLFFLPAVLGLFGRKEFEL